MKKYSFYKDNNKVIAISAHTMQEAKTEYMRLFNLFGDWYNIPNNKRPDNIKCFG